MNYAVILAGGSGTRFSNKLPKQFHILGDKPILIHTIENMINTEEISNIVIVTHKDYIDMVQTYINKYFYGKNIYITKGGETRLHSLINGCNYIKEKFRLEKEDVLVIHEAVRPFINKRMITEVIDGLKEFDGVSAAQPVQETMFEVHNGNLTNIPDRSHIYIGQNPQAFKIVEFIETYEELSQEEKDKGLNEAEIYLLKNKKMGTVSGEKHNIKITTPYDLKLSEFIMSLKP